MTTTAGRPRSIEILAEGEAPFLNVDPDGFREYVREHKVRGLTPKVMSEKDAVAKFVADGDYLVYDCNYLMRGPSSLMREIMRQRKRDIWLCGKFTYPDVAMLVAAGCVNKVDCGFFNPSPPITRTLKEGKLEIYEYSNVVITQRLAAGAMGIPFLPLRSFGGTDGFKHSGAKLITDPYTGQATVIVPALNPDVAIIHVQQSDAYGNARVFGTGIAHVESALASKKVIISTEEIIDTEEIRRNPGLTAIPYYAVDAVVEAPFGAWPGEVQGYYASDREGVIESFAVTRSDSVDKYIAKYIDPFADDREMLDKAVGAKRLLELRRRATIKEGYHA